MADLSKKLKSVLAALGLVFFCSSLLAGVLQPISGHVVAVNSILPADVLARSILLRDELILIQSEIGKPDEQYARVRVSNAAPHEVYFQALTLFNKTNRLAFEYTGVLLKTPVLVDSTKIRPYHVWNMVTAALQRVQTVKSILGIPEMSKEIEAALETTPSDVYASVVIANKVINNLLIKNFSPSDVFQIITSINYTIAEVLVSFPDAEIVMESPKLVRRKQPRDVFSELLKCHSLLNNIAEKSGESTLKFNSEDMLRRKKAPSDVYDLSASLLANIARLHALRTDSKRPAKSYYPGRKTPSEVMQRAQLLYKQLELLLTLVNKNPDWLS